MNKIKVLHIGIGPNKGGLESFTYNIQNHINLSEFQFDYTNTFDKPVAYENEKLEQGSKIFNLCPRKRNPIKSYIQLKNIINNEKYDYVHFHCMHYCWFEPILITCKKTEAQMIVHSHLTGFNHKTSKKEIILDKLGRIMTKKCNFLKLACGEQAGKWLFNNKNFKIITNGIDITQFRFDNIKRKENREKYNIDNDIVIGHVGNFSYQKNYPKLIEIFYEMHKLDNRYKLMLVGDDKKGEAERIKEMIKSLGLEEFVIFTGLIDNRINIYSAFDLYIFPSFYEGLNISLIEAQCSGLLCFASNKLDLDTNVNGKYNIINIDDQSKNLANRINAEYNKNKSYNRLDVEIDEKYSIEYSTKVLSDFYKKNIKSR